MQGTTPPDTVNREGELAWDMKPLEKLVNVTATCLFGEDKFYDTAKKSADQLYSAIDAAMKVDPYFVLRLAYYARTELYLRTTPQVLLVRSVMSKDAPKTKEWADAVKAFAPATMQRADEILGVAAYLIDNYWQASASNQSVANVAGVKSRKSGRFPKHLRHAIETRLNAVDEYQVTKYFSTSAMKGRDVKVRDLLRLVHPKAKDATQNELFKYLLGHPSKQEVREHPELLDYVAPATKEQKRHDPETYPYDDASLARVKAMQEFNSLQEFNDATMEYIRKWKIPWNFVSSKFGRDVKAWNALAPVMPIMSLVMNLRNLLEVGADITPVVAKLRNPDVIQRSKLFPFRFLTANREIERMGTPDYASTNRFGKARHGSNGTDPFGKKAVLDALETAMQLSIANLQTLKGRTLVAADNSGSMSTNHISEKSTVTCKDIANTFAGISSHLFEEAIIGTFADYFAIVPIRENGSIIENAKKIGSVDVGGSTNGWKIFEYLMTGREDHSNDYLNPWTRRIIGGRYQYNPATGEYNEQPKSPKNAIPVDRVVIFTDNELWSTSFQEHVVQKYEDYCKLTGTRPFLYLIDMTGYGETCFPPNTPKCAMISGWSENLFKFIDLFERGITTQVEYVKKIAAPGTGDGNGGVEGSKDNAEEKPAE